MIGGLDGFVARCSVVGTAVYVDIACDSRSAAHLLADPRRRASTSRAKRPTAIPIHAATIAAGLVVTEFVRFAAGRSPNRAIRFDLRSLSLEVREPA